MAVLTPQTITVYRGEAARLTFTVAPLVNISGWTLRFTVTKATNATAKLIGPLAMSITDGPNGLFQVDLTEELLNLTPGTLKWDAWRTDEGLEKPVAIGDFVVLGNSRVPPTESA